MRKGRTNRVKRTKGRSNNRTKRNQIRRTSKSKKSKTKNKSRTKKSLKSNTDLKKFKKLEKKLEKLYMNNASKREIDKTSKQLANLQKKMIKANKKRMKGGAGEEGWRSKMRELNQGLEKWLIENGKKDEKKPWVIDKYKFLISHAIKNKNSPLGKDIRQEFGWDQVTLENGMDFINGLGDKKDIFLQTIEGYLWNDGSIVEER